MISGGHANTSHASAYESTRYYPAFSDSLAPHKTHYFAMPVPAKVVFKKDMQSDYPWCLPLCAMVLTSQRRLGKNYANGSSPRFHINRSLLPPLRLPTPTILTSECSHFLNPISSQSSSKRQVTRKTHRPCVRGTVAPTWLPSTVRVKFSSANRATYVFSSVPYNI